MVCYLYEGERLVIEGEGWGIIIDDRYEGRGYREGAVYGTHQACTKDYNSDEKDDDEVRYSYGENCWEPDVTRLYEYHRDVRVARCYLCEAAVPDEVQALILLQSWNSNGERGKA